MPDSVTRFGGQTMSNLLSSEHEAMTAKRLLGSSAFRCQQTGLIDQLSELPAIAPTAARSHL